MMAPSRKKMASGIYPGKDLIRKARNDPACQPKPKAKKQSPPKFSRVVTTGYPAMKFASPKRKMSPKVSPKRKTASPKRKTASPKRKTASPKRKTASPKRKTASPKRKTASPKRKTASPKRKTASPKRKTASVKSKGIKIKRKLKIASLMNAKVKTASPKRKTASPKVGSPKAGTAPIRRIMPSMVVDAAMNNSLQQVGTKGQQTTMKRLQDLISRVENKAGEYGRKDKILF